MTDVEKSQLDVSQQIARNGNRIAIVATIIGFLSMCGVGSLILTFFNFAGDYRIAIEKIKNSISVDDMDTWSNETIWLNRQQNPNWQSANIWEIRKRKDNQ